MKRKPAIALGVVIAAFVGAVVYKSAVAPAPAAAPANDAAAPVASTAPSASPAEDAAAVATVDAGEADAAEDGGEAVIAHGVSDGKPLPPLASGAVWSVVRWDMTRAQIEDAFKAAGTTPRAGTGTVVVKGNSVQGTISLAANKPNQISVVTSGLSKEAAASTTAKMRERAGAPTRTSERIAHRWKKPTGTATLVAASDGASWTMREEYAKGSGGGTTGFAQLTWGMAPPAVEQALKAAGWNAHVTKASAAAVDPCSMPNAPPDCAKKGAAQSVVFTKGEQEGTASFGDAGLSQIVVSGPAADRAQADARAAEVERALGKAATVETSTKTQHADAASKIELEVRERQPDGSFTVLETYRPRK